MTKGTIVRTIVLFLALVNQILVSFGKSPIPLDEAMINDIVVQLDMLLASIFTAVAAIVAWWKDNDVRKETIEKKKRINELRKEGRGE